MIILISKHLPFVKWQAMLKLKKPETRRRLQIFIPSILFDVLNIK